MAAQVKKKYRLEEFELDIDKRLLKRVDGEVVHLASRPFQVLLYLIENRERVVSREELLEIFWDGRDVYDVNVTKCIGAIRKAFNEQLENPRFIETRWAEGYRYIGPLEEKLSRDFIEIEKSQAVVSEDIEEAMKEEEYPISHKTEEKPKPQLTRNDTALPTKKSHLALVGLLLLIGGGLSLYFWLTRQPKQPETVLEVKSIAVLPFKNIGHESESEYLGQGMAEVITTKLSNLRQIVVRPTSAVLKYSNATPDPKGIGRELGVDALLDGSVQRTKDSVRVTVHLVRVSDGATIWGEAFDDKFTNIFAVQDSISERVTRALALKLSGPEKEQIAKRHTENTEAYQLYLKGRFFWNKRTAEGYRKAIEHFNEALAKDPGFALAYTGLSDCYVMGGGGLPAEESFSKAKTAAMKAIELDESLAEAHASLGLVKEVYDWDFVGAENEFKRALKLGPNNATTHQWYADYLLVKGRHKEALDHLERAREIDPASLIINREVGRAYYFARRYDEAIEHLQKTLEMDENFAPALIFLGYAFERKGMHKESITTFEKLTNNRGPQALYRASLAYAYARAGRKDEAQKILSELNETSKQTRVSALHMAVVHLGLGQSDQAIEWLNKAYQERSYRLIYISVDPIFDGLRTDSRFQDLLARVGV